MPYSKKQNALFRAAVHDSAIAKKHGMSMAEAGKMAAEGVKKKKRSRLAELAKGDA